MSMKNPILFIPLTVFILIGVFLLRGISLDPADVPSALVGKKIPAFSLYAIDGNKLITEKELYGRVILLNIWATWCVSCRMEHPMLLALSQQGIPIIGVDYKDDSSAAKDWIAKFGNPYLINIADTQGKLGLDLGVSGAPETFLIDKDGVIRYRRTGVIDEKIWREEISPIYYSLME